jgi:hypothetical protein
MPRFGRPPRRPVPPRFPGRRRPFGAVRPLAPGPIRALAHANQLFAEGQFGPAAEKYEMLANAARANSLPVAPRLFYQAARANWRAGNVPQGMQLLRNGLDLLRTAGAVGRLRQIASSAIGELEQMGQEKKAEEIKNYLKDIPEPAAGPAGGIPAVPARVTLPTHCGQCGAAIRSDEVEWIDERTAECAFCGSPVRPEKD